MNYVIRKSDGKITFSKKGGILKAGYLLCEIDKEAGKFFIYNGNDLQASFLLKDINSIKGVAITKGIDRFTYIGYAVKVITEEFEYLIDINANSAEEAKQLATELNNSLK